MQYDVIIQNNNVYIGMEDVSVTYIDTNRTENISLEDAKQIIAKAASEFANNEDVKRMIGKKSYYPMQWEKPCRAILVPHNTIDFMIRNYSDLSKAESKGAIEIVFSSNMEDNMTTIENMDGNS